MAGISTLLHSANNGTAPKGLAQIKPPKKQLKCHPSFLISRDSISYHNNNKNIPDDKRLPLLPLMILPLLPMLASLEVFRVPVSVRSIAISLRLLAAWILDWKKVMQKSVLD